MKAQTEQEGSVGVSTNDVRGISLILGMIFKQVFPVWQQYQGKVPEKVPEWELNALDRAAQQRSALQKTRPRGTWIVTSYEQYKERLDQWLRNHAQRKILKI